MIAKKVLLYSFASLAVTTAAVRDLHAQIRTDSTSNSSATSGSNSNSNSNSQSSARTGNSTASTGQTSAGVTFNSGNNSPTNINNPNHTSSDDIIRSAPTVYVPNVVTGNVCALGASAGASWLGAGFGVGASWESMQCERRQQAALLHNAGYKQASRELMCDQREIYDAMKRGGTPCLPRPAWDGPVASQSAPMQPMPMPVPGPAPQVQYTPAPAPQQQSVPRCNARKGIVDNCYSG